MATLKTKICIRRDIQEKLNDKILEEGEIAYATNTNKLAIGAKDNQGYLQKFGDLPNIGSSAVSGLPFVEGAKGPGQSEWTEKSMVATEESKIATVQIENGSSIAYRLPEDYQDQILTLGSGDKIGAGKIYRNRELATGTLKEGTVVHLTYVKKGGPAPENEDGWFWTDYSSDAASVLTKQEGSYKVFSVSAENNLPKLMFSRNEDQLDECQNNVVFDPSLPMYIAPKSIVAEQLLDARTLQLTGVVQLPEVLLPKHANNEKGFFENQAVFVRCWRESQKLPSFSGEQNGNANNQEHLVYIVDETIKEVTPMVQNLNLAPHEKSSGVPYYYVYLGQSTKANVVTLAAESYSKSIELSLVHPVYTYDSGRWCTIENKLPDITVKTEPSENHFISDIQYDNGKITYTKKLPFSYWADQKLSANPDYNTNPTVKAISFNASKAQTDASSRSMVSLQYNETDQCLEFIFK